MEEIFKVEPTLQERIINKCQKSQGIEFGFGLFKVRLQGEIIHDFLKMPEKEAGDVFGRIVIDIFLQTCNEYRIPYSPLNIHVVADDEIEDRASSVIIEREDDNSRWGLILTPRISWDLDELWGYYLLHELGHCWIPSCQIDPDHPDLPFIELFLDLIAICCLRKVFLPHERTYKELLKSVTHIGGIGGRKVLGEKKQKYILENPEAFLRKFTGNIVLLFKEQVP